MDSEEQPLLHNIQLKSKRKVIISIGIIALLILIPTIIILALLSKSITAVEITQLKCGLLFNNTQPYAINVQSQVIDGVSAFYKYNWQFSDGLTNNSANVEHTFTSFNYVNPTAIVAVTHSLGSRLWNQQPVLDSANLDLLLLS